MAGRLKDEGGSALILAVIAMLVMGVLSVSFALLADMETRIGVNYKMQAQAEALAEAALERARDSVRTAPTQTGGFTNFFTGGGTPATGVAHVFPWNGTLLSAGRYWARIDNDCTAVHPGPPQWFPSTIEEKAVGVTPCSNDADTNETAIITAWARTGADVVGNDGAPGIGRARVRAVVAVSNPWKHVCSDAAPDNNGYCNDPLNRNGNPTVSPADPNDPNGPASYTDLPRPILGCSLIDPSMHFVSAPDCPNPPNLSNPTLYTYTSGAYSPAIPAGRHVVLMGENPGIGATPTGGVKMCYDGGPTFRYWGYFDCALSTPCVDAGCPRQTAGCVRPGDPRTGFSDVNGKHRWRAAVLGLDGQYHCPGGGAGADSLPATGMVYNWNPFTAAPINRAAPSGGGNSEEDPTFNGQFGDCSPGPITVSPTRQCVEQPPPPTAPNTPYGRNAYVLTNGGHGIVEIKNTGAGYTYFYGTLVVEGNHDTGDCGGNPKDVALGNQGVLSTAKINEYGGNPGGFPVKVYGYPVTLIVFDPLQVTASPSRPTVNPYNPQTTCADMGSSNSYINGMVYSGGHVQFNPIAMSGTVVAFEIQTQGSATYTYNPTYGNETPPPGFPAGGGNQVVIIRKSFITCVSYSDDTNGPDTEASCR